MVHISKIQRFFILFFCALSFLYAAPNFLPAAIKDKLQKNMPAILPVKTLNLGLDLQGGAHLLLQTDMDSVFTERADGLLQSLRTTLRKNKISYRRLSVIPEKAGIKIMLRDAASEDQVKTIKDLIHSLDADLDIEYVAEDKRFDAVLPPAILTNIRNQTIAQSIEIIRRRVDETGTKEPVIQRQGDNRIIVQLPGVKDPDAVRNLLGTTAKLSFQLVAIPTNSTTAQRESATTRLPYHDIERGDVEVETRTLITGDMLDDAQPSLNNGEATVSFKLNGIGARRFCEVSRENVGRPFAIILDNEVISDPVIRDEICGGQGQISGNFTLKSANDLALLLRAGALPAPLKILEERSVGPSLGQDSIHSGGIAGVAGFVFVCIFMFLIYGLFGFFSNIALFVNVAGMLGLLSLLQATLTLPGIAGIVLTIGIAVDANVLIFERIKDEMRAGRSPLASIDAGYKMAMSTVMDSNITTLIGAFILYVIGTGPVKGFAVTLAIGIITSLFSAIMVTRLIILTWYNRTKPEKLPL
jgi:preprotein translocase subunit SecD